MPTTRFKKGNKVEVWNRREVPSGSWWSAEIISGNGHTYSVRYAGYPMDSSVAVDRVPRKAIRPCPPPLEDQKELQIGDVVELFDNNSWKIAEVRMIIGNGYCSMRLLGSCKKFACHKSRIRRQLFWQDNKWMVIHKDFGEESHGQLSSSMRGGTSICHVPQSREKIKTSFGDNHFPAVFSGSIKKRPLDMPIHADMCNAGRKKMRAIVKDDIFEQETTENSSKSALKMDFLASSGRLLGEKCTGCYLNKRVGPSRNESGRSMLRSDTEKNLLNSSVLNAAESTSSSVGSCSVDSSHEECYSQSDHAETSCGFETDSSFSRKGPKMEASKLCFHRPVMMVDLSLLLFHQWGKISILSIWVYQFWYFYFCLFLFQAFFLPVIMHYERIHNQNAYRTYLIALNWYLKPFIILISNI